jgi:hypothetical protein
MIAAVVVAVAALVVVLGIAAVRENKPDAQPVAISAVPAPQADGPDCRNLLGALPDALGDFRRAPTADPTPAGAAAWRAGPTDEPVILRCGLDRPGDFVVGTPVTAVDDVAWFRVGEAGVGNDGVGEAGVGNDGVGEAGVGEADTGGGTDQRTTWYAVDRPVYVALTLPAGTGPTPIQVISDVVAETLPARAPAPGPAP